MLLLTKSALLLILFKLLSFCFYLPYSILQSVVTKEDGITHETKLEIVTYGTKSTHGDRSGAYLFLPDGEAKVGLEVLQLVHSQCI